MEAVGELWVEKGRERLKLVLSLHVETEYIIMHLRQCCSQGSGQRRQWGG